MDSAPATIRLGLIISDRNHYFHDILGSVLAHAHTLGRIRFDFIEDSLEAILAYKEPVRLDGLIAHPLSRREYAFFRRRGTSVVNLSTRERPENFPSWVAHVVSDDEAIGRLAAHHFAAMSLRNYAFFGNDQLHFSVLRERGFQKEFERIKKRISPNADLTYHCWREGAQGFDAWLASLPRPVGILAAQDNYARTVLREVVAGGASVPRDVAVIGVDHDPVLYELSPVHLASVLPDAVTLGQTMVDVLIDIVEGRRRAEDTFVRIPPAGIHYDESAPRFHSADPTVARALRWMETHLTEPVDMETLAAAVGVSRRSLEYLFRNQVGVSPYQKLLEMRLLRARQLLTGTNKTVTVIAAETGFSNTREFCVRFRQKVGCTPGQFRVNPG